jgi:hypothetical protein
MTVYMVERNLKGIAMSDLAAAQRWPLPLPMPTPRRARPYATFDRRSHPKMAAKLPYSRVVEALDLMP